MNAITSLERLTRADAALDAVRRYLSYDPRDAATQHHHAVCEAQGAISAVMQDLHEAAGKNDRRAA